MQTVGEIPREPYAEIVRFLLDAGAPVPARLWDGAPPPAEPGRVNVPAGGFSYVVPAGWAAGDATSRAVRH